MKKFIKALVLSAVLSTTMVVSAFNPQTVLAEEASKGFIAVTGQGKVNVEPDIAIITLGVVTDAVEALDAQKTNAETMEKVISTVKEFGIKDSDIKTAYFYVNKQYDYSDYNRGGQPKEVGYTVNNAINVTVRNISDVGRLLDVAMEAGANQNNGIQFSISNPELYYGKALEAAVANARSKANVLANAINVTIGSPTSITENSYGSVTPLYSERAMAGGVAYDSSSSQATPISAGELEISAAVTMQFDYQN